MKKSRLLEIVREEISIALNEAGLFTLKNPTDAKKGLAQTIDPDDTTEKSPDFMKKYKKVAEAELEEDQLNEVPDFGGPLDKEVAIKYGEEETLEAATEKITNRVLSDKGITKEEVKNMSPEELKKLLKDIRSFISQKNQTPEVKAALEKQKEIESGRPGGYTGKELQDNQTNKAILRALGFGSKKGPKGPTKNKEEKPASTGKKGRPAGSGEKKAVRTPGEDGFDKVEYVDKEEAKAAAAAAKADKSLGGKYAAELSSEDESKYKEYKSDITSLVNDLEKKYDKLKMEELKLYLEDSEVRRLFKSKGVKLSDLVRSVIK